MTLRHPEAEPEAGRPGQDVPRLAEGIELVGEYAGSGTNEALYLVRRADGQFIHLSRLLYLVAEAVDGRRDLEEIAERVSAEFGRRVTADNVLFLAQKKLAPLGVLATAEPIELPRYKESVLGLNYRLGLVPAGVVRHLTTPLLFLFWPPVVVAVLCGLVALDVWIVFVHGVGEGVLDILYQPSLLLAFFALELVEMAWHEVGHATACRYGGAKPGKVGAGFYIIWFVFFCDVTDSYRLDKVGRLRTDAGGLYFDAIATLAFVGAYFLTGFEPLLALALWNQLAAVDELSPFLRLDGYYIVSDLTGVPNLFSYVKPVALSLIPGREADERVKALKPWVRTVVTVWVLAVIPVLGLGFAMLVFYGPWFIANAWDSFWVQYGELTRAFDDGRIVDGVWALVDVVVLVTPVIGGALIFSWVSKLLIVAGWSWSKGRPLLRTGFTMVPVAVVALLFFVWWPQLGPLGPIGQVEQVERGDIPGRSVVNPKGMNPGSRDRPTHERETETADTRSGAAPSPREQDHRPMSSGPVNSAAGVPAPTPTVTASARATATASTPASTPASATASTPASATASATASAAPTGTSTGTQEPALADGEGQAGGQVGTSPEPIQPPEPQGDAAPLQEVPGADLSPVPTAPAPPPTP